MLTKATTGERTHCRPFFRHGLTLFFVITRIHINPQTRPGSFRRLRRGFALIITLTLMVLLTLLVVGLLSLSTIALRAAAQGEAMATARANARLSLLLALGELQRQAGSDTRVTARADILTESSPPVLGVWKSWQGTDHETTGSFAGRPQPPGSSYSAEKAKRFVAWLTSANISDAATLPDTTDTVGRVTLVGTGSLGSGKGRDKLEIHLQPTPVATGHQKGSLAWWIGGENQKARLPNPYKPDPVTSVARWAVLAKSHAIADPVQFRLEPLLKDATAAAKALTLGQADLIATKSDTPASREFFYDLSAVSVGLLTNTATGAWRKDLSLLTEKWDAQPTSNLPLFRLTPTVDAKYTRPAPGNAVPAASMLYPWAGYRGSNDTAPIYQQGPVTSWANLVDYATMYKRISANSSGKMSIATQAVAVGGDSFSFLHKVRIMPVIARMQWVFSHSAGAVASDPSKLEPRLLLTPVITMWNPYNMEITTPGALSFSVRKPLPAALCYTINGVTNRNYHALFSGNTSNGQALSTVLVLNYQINDGFLLKPGETRLFSPTATTAVTPDVAIPLTVGYRSGGGHYFQVMDDANRTLILPAASSIKADAKFDTTCNNEAVLRVTNGVTVYVDMSVAGTWILPYRACYSPDIANVIYKPLTQMAEGTLSQCLTNPVPFLSTLFGARMASRTHIAAKGFVQSSPFVDYTAMGFEDLGDIGRHYGGTSHPVNSTFDYSFVKHPAGGDSLLPNASDTSGRGYIVSGFSKSDGLSRCVIDELPSRPLVSLGELVNWDLRYENPVPPFAFNLIGNSDATPLLPANAVVNSADAGLTENLQYDDSYCANHLLFDDWFVSSITPDPTNFGSSGRSLQVTYTDFVTGRTPLGNRAYHALPADQALAAVSSAQATSLYNDHVSKTDSWKSIASRFEVDGMFNVNSTSVAAWRALLGHARHLCVPYIRESAGSWDVGLSAESDYACNRFSIAGDVKAGVAGSSGDFPEASEFTGYRTLDSGFLDAMAKEVVRQVRLRGPFLSLAEFVNRQLSGGDLAPRPFFLPLVSACESKENYFGLDKAPHF